MVLDTVQRFFKMHQDGILFGAFVGAGIWLFLKTGQQTQELESLAMSTSGLFDKVVGGAFSPLTWATFRVLSFFILLGSVAGAAISATINQFR